MMDEMNSTVQTDTDPVTKDTVYITGSGNRTTVIALPSPVIRHEKTNTPVPAIVTPEKAGTARPKAPSPAPAVGRTIISIPAPTLLALPEVEDQNLAWQQPTRSPASTPVIINVPPTGGGEPGIEDSDDGLDSSGTTTSRNASSTTTTVTPMVPTTPPKSHSTFNIINQPLTTNLTIEVTSPRSSTFVGIGEDEAEAPVGRATEVNKTAIVAPLVVLAGFLIVLFVIIMHYRRQRRGHRKQNKTGTNGTVSSGNNDHEINEAIYAQVDRSRISREYTTGNGMIPMKPLSILRHQGEGMDCSLQSLPTPPLHTRGYRHTSNVSLTDTGGLPTTMVDNEVYEASVPLLAAQDTFYNGNSTTDTQEDSMDATLQAVVISDPENSSSRPCASDPAELTCADLSDPDSKPVCEAASPAADAQSWHDYDPVYIPSNDPRAMEKRLDKSGYIKSRRQQEKLRSESTQPYEEVLYTEIPGARAGHHGDQSRLDTPGSPLTMPETPPPPLPPANRRGDRPGRQEQSLRSPPNSPHTCHASPGRSPASPTRRPMPPIPLFAGEESPPPRPPRSASISNHSNRSYPSSPAPQPRHKDTGVPTVRDDTETRGVQRSDEVVYDQPPLRDTPPVIPPTPDIPSDSDSSKDDMYEPVDFPTKPPS